MTNTLVEIDFTWWTTYLYPTVPITTWSVIWCNGQMCQLAIIMDIPKLEPIKIKNWPININIHYNNTLKWLWFFYLNISCIKINAILSKSTWIFSIYCCQILENIKIIGPYKEEIWIPKHWTCNITIGRQLCPKTRTFIHETITSCWIKPV